MKKTILFLIVFASSIFANAFASTNLDFTIYYKTNSPPKMVAESSTPGFKSYGCDDSTGKCNFAFSVSSMDRWQAYVTIRNQDWSQYCQFKFKSDFWLNPVTDGVTCKGNYTSDDKMWKSGKVYMINMIEKSTK